MAKKCFLRPIVWLLISTLVFLIGGCSLSPARKPDIGPAGSPTESKSNPPLAARFAAPPTQLYDLEAIAANTFDGINTNDWQKAGAGLVNLQAAWRDTKSLVGDMKGVTQSDGAIQKLAASIAAKNRQGAYEDLNKFMVGVTDIGKSYKLSPVADIINVGNGIRSVAFYVENNEWTKASLKAKQLDNTWHQVKTSFEKVGILNQVTETHSKISQLSDAVDAQDKSAVEGHIADINETMGRIREFYRGQ